MIYYYCQSRIVLLLLSVKINMKNKFQFDFSFDFSCEIGERANSAAGNKNGRG